MRKTAWILMLFLPFFLLTSCKDDDTNPIVSIEVDTAGISQAISLDVFDLSDIELIITYEDQTTARVPLSTQMLDPQSLALISTPGTHTITINHAGLNTTFAITLFESSDTIAMPDITFATNFTLIVNSEYVITDNFPATYSDEVLVDGTTYDVSLGDDQFQERYYIYDIDGKSRVFEYRSNMCWHWHDPMSYTSDEIVRTIEYIIYDISAQAPKTIELSWFDFVNGWYVVKSTALQDLSQLILTQRGVAINLDAYRVRLIGTGVEVELTHTVNGIPYQTHFVYKDIGTTVIEVDDLNICYGQTFLLSPSMTSMTLSLVDYIGTDAVLGIPNRGQPFDMVIENILEKAFANASDLETIYIPASVKEIGDAAFIDAANLKSVTLEGLIPPLLGTDVFLGTSPDLIITVPPDALTAYQQAPGWQAHAHRMVAGPYPQTSVFKVSFENEWGSSTSPAYVMYQSPMAEPTEPERNGYQFLYWHEPLTPDVPYDFGIMPGHDVYLLAKFEQMTYTVTFDTGGGPMIDTFIGHEGDFIDTPIPEWEGYWFVGWYMDPEMTTPMNIQYILNENLTFYAFWVPDEFQVNYYVWADQSASFIDFGYATGMATTERGRLFTWGSNNYGLLGDGSGQSYRATPKDIHDQFDFYVHERVLRGDFGIYHSAVLTNYARLFMWGRNAEGQFGTDDVYQSTTPVNVTGHLGLTGDEHIVDVSLGNTHTVILTSFGRVFVMGGNSKGQLGDGTTINSSSPTDITDQFGLVNDHIVNIHALGDHTFAITANGLLFGFGDNDEHRIKNIPDTSVLTPHQIDFSTLLQSGERITDVSSGSAHVHVLTSEGRLFGWGDNTYGQLGNGTFVSSSEPLDITPHLGLTSNESVESIATGNTHVLIITTHLRAFSWGSNSYHELGIDTLGAHPTPTDLTPYIPYVEDEQAIQVYAGASNSMLRTSHGRIFAFGDNTFGQHGDGTTTVHSTPVEVMNDLRAPSFVHHLNVSTGEPFPDYVHVYPGHTFSGWYEDKDLTIPFDDDVMPPRDLVLYGTHTPQTFTLTVIGFDGISVLQSSTYLYGADLSGHIYPEAPLVDHHVFIGFDPVYDMMPGYDAVVYATYDIETYPVTFLDDILGNIISVDMVAHGDAAIPPADPEKSASAEYHYIFDGWDTGFDVVEGPLTVSPLWLSIPNTYTLTYDSHDGTPVSSETFAYGTILDEPLDPSKDGYTFDGWTTIDLETDGLWRLDIHPSLGAAGYVTETYDGNITVTMTSVPSWASANMIRLIQDTSSLGWTDSGHSGHIHFESGHTYALQYFHQGSHTGAFNVVFGSNDGQWVQYYAINNMTIPDIMLPGQSVFSLQNPPTYYNNPGMIIIELGLFFRGKADGSWVTFDDMFLLMDDNGQVVDTGGVIKAEHYIFDTMPAHDLALHAIWTPNDYVMSFDTKGGSPIDPITYSFASQITPPIPPVKEGHTFDGWALDGSPFEFDTMPSHDVALDALWTQNTYTVTFVNADDSVLETQDVLYGLAAATPSDPSVPPTGEETYVFLGWDRTFDIITEDIVVKALYDAEPTIHLISFETYGGTVIPDTSLAFNASLASYYPEKVDYLFKGWHTDASLTNKIITVPSYSGTLYAKWVERTVANMVDFVQVGESGTSYSVPYGLSTTSWLSVDGGFMLATTETTYELWYEVLIWAQDNGYTFTRLGMEGSMGIAGAAPTENKRHPVTQVSWCDVVVWLNAYSEMNGFDPVYRSPYDGSIVRDASDSSVARYAVQSNNNGYRLPTLAEWEMAAKWTDYTSSDGRWVSGGGRFWTPGDYASGAQDSVDNVLETSRVAVAFSVATENVGMRDPNALGLYDMTGNVTELLTTGHERGGSYVGQGGFLYVGYYGIDDRWYSVNDRGFRIARDGA